MNSLNYSSRLDEILLKDFAKAHVLSKPNFS